MLYMGEVEELRGPVEAAIAAARNESDVVVRAVWERWCIAQFAGSVRKVRRRGQGKLWLRAGTSRWLTGELSTDAALALAEQLDHDGGGLSDEPPQRTTVDRSLEPIPEDDQEALARGMATLGIATDNPSARVWLHRQELLMRSDGTEVSQSISTSWDEIYRFGGSLVGSVDGHPVAIPPPSTSDATIGHPPIIVADPAAVLSLAAAAVQELRTSGAAPPRLGRQSIAAPQISIQRDPEVLASLPAFDAEGVPCRFQPLVSRGVAVGLLSDRSGAHIHELSRSSGSLLDFNDRLQVGIDALTVTGDDDGPLSLAELAGDVVDGVLLRGPVQVVSTGEGARIRGRASVIRNGEISKGVGPLELPDVSVLLKRVQAVTQERQLAAVLEGGSRPVVGNCPAVLIHLPAAR